MKKQNNTYSASAEITIYDNIGCGGITAKDFANSLVELGDVKNLVVRINSYGGEVFDGFVIYNRLREHAASKIIIIDNLVAGIASVIAMSGDTIKITQNGFVMINNPTVMTLNNSTGYTSKTLDKIKKSIIDIYTKKVERKIKNKLSSLMDSETWFNATEAYNYGFVDEIIN